MAGSHSVEGAVDAAHLLAKYGKTKAFSFRGANFDDLWNATQGPGAVSLAPGLRIRKVAARQDRKGFKEGEDF
eukprot:5517532-Lingulodinium_polyedra.AAC.1